MRGGLTVEEILTPAPWSRNVEPAVVRRDERGRLRLVLLRGARQDIVTTRGDRDAVDILVPPRRVNVRPGEIVWIDFSREGRSKWRKIGDGPLGTGIYVVHLITDRNEVAKRVAYEQVVEPAIEKAKAGIRGEREFEGAIEYLRKNGLEHLIPEDLTYAGYPISAYGIAAKIETAGRPDVAYRVRLAASEAARKPIPKEELRKAALDVLPEASKVAEAVRKWRPTTIDA